MNFVFLKGDTERATRMVELIARGAIQPQEQVRLLSCTIEADATEILMRLVKRERRNLWPFITQNDNDEILLRMAW